MCVLLVESLNSYWRSATTREQNDQREKRRPTAGQKDLATVLVVAVAAFATSVSNIALIFAAHLKVQPETMPFPWFPSAVADHCSKRL